MKNESLAIYGGTFSPPHRGHRRAAEVLLDALSPDRLLVIPTNLPPHKAVSPSDSPLHRLEMTRLCFGDLPRTEVSDLEIRRTGKSYTVETLEALTAQGRDLYFLCGTDMLLSFEGWYRFRDIFALTTLVFERRETDPTLDGAVREAVERYRRDYGARIIELAIDPIKLSSTEVRAAIRSGAPRERITEMIPDSVADYIALHGLYKDHGGR